MGEHLESVVRLGRKDAYRCSPSKAKELLATGRWEPALPPPVVKSSSPAPSPKSDAKSNDPLPADSFTKKS